MLSGVTGLDAMSRPMPKGPKPANLRAADLWSKTFAEFARRCERKAHVVLQHMNKRNPKDGSPHPSHPPLLDERKQTRKIINGFWANIQRLSAELVSKDLSWPRRWEWRSWGLQAACTPRSCQLIRGAFGTYRVLICV